MKMLELLQEHPKTAIVIKQWFLEKMLESLKDESLPEDFKNYVREQGIDDEKIANMVEASPRSLFDIFDEHKIHVEILHEVTGFWWKIKDDKTFLRLGNDPYKIRTEAEKESIIESFKLLEEKL